MYASKSKPAIKTMTLMKGIFRALFLGLLFFLPSDLIAEGTRQLMPASTDFGYIQIYDLNTLTRPFAGFNCPSDDRLNITICQPGEIIYMGFRQTDNDVHFRLKDPNGNTVTIPGLTAVAGFPNTYLLPSAGMGRINNYTQAFNGPLALAAGGYDAMSYVTTMTGEYYVEFNPVSPNVITPIKRIFTYFDITVASPANVRINGRVWSQTWDFTTNGGNNQFRAIMYIYSDDGVVTALNCNGMRPFGFTMSCNSTGCTDTGDPAADRRSRFGNATYPQYKIFLNNPDENCFPTGSFGSLTLPTTITGCGGNRCINISVDKPGNIAVLLDLNGSVGYNPGTVDRQLFADVVVGTNCVPWDGLDGLGNVVATGINITLQIDYFNGITHLPLHDVEHNDNGYIVTLVRPIPAIPTPPRLFWDDAPITTGTATDGLTNFAGCSNPGGCHRWVNRGNNSNPETINTWWYANIITENINYNNNSINVDADIRNPGSGSANDTTVCGLVAPVQLAGAVTGAAGGGEWVTTGTGAFAPSITAMNATYTPSLADINNGFVYLKLTSTFNGPCPSVSDSIRINLAPAPTANAGPNQSICSNTSNATVTLAGSFTVATGALWSGAGTFVPSLTNMGATYAPTATEITNGSATVTLTTTGNGLCPEATDQMVITIDPAPTVDAGPDQTVCANNSNATLAAVVTNATSQTWSAPSGSFNNNSIVNAVFTPAVGTNNLTLTLTATKAGCNAVTDQVVITVNPAPTANAGSNQSVCHNNSAVTLAGVTTNSTGITWTGGLGTFNPNNTTLNAVYTPSLGERNSGSVVLTLTATRAGCTPATDPMTITITPAPVANAGNDELVCANNPTIAITTASISGATGGTWTGAGGSFVPGVTTINPQYTLSLGEVSTGVTSLILTTVGNGNCNPDTDTMQIIVLPAPLPDAGPDQTVCHNNSVITLAGTADFASGASWSTTTGGSFADINDLNTTYTPTLAERNAGTITLTLTATETDCNPVSDQVTITIEPAPTANAGSNQSVCHNNSNVTLNGSVTNATSRFWSGGAGTFVLDNTSLNAVYTPTLTERNTGSVTLTLNAVRAGCITVTDPMTITITASPTVDAGTYTPVCANNPTITLSGTSSTGVGTWTGAGTFSNSSTLVGSTYTPSAAEIAALVATVTLTSNNNGNCGPVTDQATINITPAPVPNAGPDQTVCADLPSVTLNGSSTVATGGIWSGGLGTFNPNNTSFNTIYTPTLAEINNGSVTLTMTTTNNGNCNPVSNDMTITINSAPTVNAGADQVVCGNVANVPINGAITVASGATWTSSGTGTFSNANNLSTAYIPSATDLTNATVTLTLTTTGNGLCQAVSDQLIITFTSVPSINAGPNQIVCTNDFPVQLNGAGSPATWSGGGGTFNPGSNALNATYTPTAAEALAGTVTLTLTTIPSGACPTISDNVTITIPQGPLANAGNDATMCGNFASFALNGTISNPATGINTGFWTTNGTGSFLPNPSALNATYNPSALDRTNGSVILTLSTTGNGPCSGHSDDMVLTIQPQIVVNAGPDQTICGDRSGITLGGTVTGATGATWSSTGSGGFAPANTNLNATYSIVLPTDTANGSVTFTLTSTGNGICPAVSDNVIYTITDAPRVNAGPDHTICADSASINLAGSVIGSAGGQWTTNGTGSFSPHAATPNTIYFPSVADRIAGNRTFTLTTTGSGLCNNISDNMTLTINPAPTAIAGSDMTICADIVAIPLNGLVTVASGGTWTTSGSGTFNNPNLLNATYNPSTADSIGGLVTLTLTTTGNGICKQAQDQLFINLTPVPSVNAGFDQNVCGKSPVSLSGTVSVSSGGTWTSTGSGTFTPNANALNAVYNPSDADTTAGAVTLTLTTNAAGNCNIYSDALTVTFENIPEVNAGPDQTICADSFYVALPGMIKNAGGLWTSTGSGTFSPNATSPNANYVPSPADKTAGLITLTLTTTGAGPCASIDDDMVLTITPAPTISAGADQLICADSAFVNLNGTFTFAGGIIWTSSGNGVFTPSSSTPNAVYTPSNNDRLAGSVTLTATTSGNGTCKAVSDNLIVSITPLPTVNAGSDQTICATQASFNLNGTITVASGGIWTTTGSGVFGPNNTTLNATYFPTSTDTAAGAVTLTLTTTGNGTCHTYSDQLTLSFDPLPVVNAGPDQTVCALSSGVNLNGSVANALSGTWSSSGGGTFSPNANLLNVSFTPSNADTTNGSVTLTLTSVDNGTCPAVTNDVLITFTPIPIINAGPNQILCADVEGVQLQGQSFNTPGVTWSSNGTGSFSNVNDLLAIYTQSNADTIAGSIVLTLSSSGGICAPVSDNMNITFTPAPTVSAGPDLTICPGLPSVNIQGSVTIATGGAWTSSGTGTFANENSLNTTYFPSVADQLAGSFTLRLTTTGNGSCSFYNDDMIVTYGPLPPINAGNDATVCTNSLPIQLNGSGVRGRWSGGLGTYAPNDSTLNATYTPHANEIVATTVTLTLTSIATGGCATTSDNVTFTINPGPTANAGADHSVCTNTPNISLNGVVTLATNGSWTSSGSGNFANASNRITTYVPSNSDKTTGSVTFTLITTTGNNGCPPATDRMVVTIIPGPTIDAGPNQTVCRNASVNLAATFTNAGGIQWSGTLGAFNTNNTDPNAIYTPTAAEHTPGPLTLTATATSTGICPVVSDQVTITFTPAPTVNAGPAQNVCANATSVSLDGTITIASGGFWSGGTGVFSPSPSTIDPTYSPTAADTTAGSVTLTLSSTGNGTCNPINNTVTISFTPVPEVNAGANDTICSGEPNIALVGQVFNATGGQWSTFGSGTFNPNNTTLSTFYEQSTQDHLNGAVNLMLTSTGPGPCAAVSDIKTVTIFTSPSASVNAGFNQVICADASEVILNGFIDIASGGVWSANGSGSFVPNITDLNAKYIPSTGDTTAGTVTITLTSVGNGFCTPVSDDMIITINSAPIAIANTPAAICADAIGAPISGAVYNAGGGIWSTSGSGSFSPDASALSGTYIPSAGDKSIGSVNLTLTTTGIGTCNAVSNTVTLSIRKIPTVNAGPDQTVCANTIVIPISGSLTDATGSLWTTSGNGNFGNANLSTTVYLPSSDDTTAGAVMLRLTTTTGIGTCAPVSDLVRITFNKFPIASAGPDQTVCSSGPGITLINGSVANSTGGQWSTNGSGTFSSTSSLNATYLPSDQDKNSGQVTLTLTTTGNGGCAPDSDDMILTVQAAPQVNAGDPVICQVSAGAALSGTFSNASGIVWSGLGAFSPSPVITNPIYHPSAAEIAQNSAKVKITSTGNGTCAAISDSAIITIDPLPLANAGQDDYVCIGSDAILSAQTSPDITYTWRTIGNVFISSDPTTSVTVNSDATFVLIVEDAKGCINSDTVTIRTYQLPSFALDPHHCLSNNLLVDSDPQNLPVVPGVYQWYRNGGILTGEDKTIIFPIEDGLFKVRYSYGNCFVDSTTNVTRPPVLSHIDFTACANSSHNITINSNVANVNYLWSTGNAGIDLNTINQSIPLDTNYFRATVTDGLGCVSMDSVRTIGLPTPSWNFPDDSSCIGLTKLLDGRPDNILNIDNLNPVYEWFKDNVDQNHTNDTLPITTAGTYVVRVKVDRCVNSDTANIKFNPNPSAVLPDKLKLCKEIDNLVILDGGEGTGYTYLWTAPAGIILDSNTTRTTAVRNEGYYKVVVTNAFDCPSEDSVFVDEICPPRVFVPTAFTPGIAGGDQKFKVFGAYTKNYKLEIFNRWGEVIFFSTDRNEGWDGNYRGEPMPIGVYTWIVTYEGEDPDHEGPYREEGSVTIIR